MKVLIFTASAGNGHNSTARKIQDKIFSKNPTAEVQIVDTYKSYAGKLRAWRMEQGYSLICNHAVSLYNYFFKQSERSTYENRDKSKANKEIYPIMYGMIKKIYEYQPDVIISTYVFNSVALRNIKRFYKIPATTICMQLDYGISPYWECCAEGLDYMFLTDESMLEFFREKGFKNNQLVATGIPVADKFSDPYPKYEARKALGLDEDLFTIVIMKASFFPVSNKDIIRELAKVSQKIQVVIVNGREQKSREDLDKIIKAAKLPHKITNLGFTNKIVEYLSACDLVLGKAGGLSTTESINVGVPSLIVDKLPQQEIYNREFLINAGCALGVNKNTIGDTIIEVMNNEQLYTSLKTSALNLRKLNVLDKFYDIISSCPEVSYEDIKFDHTKKQVIMNIDRERKNTIRNKK